MNIIKYIIQGDLPIILISFFLKDVIIENLIFGIFKYILRKVLTVEIKTSVFQIKTYFFNPIKNYLIDDFIKNLNV